MKGKFSLGRLVSTPGALEVLEEAKIQPLELIARHTAGDWGDLCDEDKEANELALKDGSRLFSMYELPTKEKLYVITEAEGEGGQRYSTCILRPDEY